MDNTINLKEYAGKTSQEIKNTKTVEQCRSHPMKLMIMIGIAVFGTVGSWLGAAMDHGNWFGGWSLLIGTIGSFFGIWAGYKIGQNLSL